jgi:SAM-dependent methyltransferase
MPPTHSGRLPDAGELSFLAEPGEVSDWRMVLAYDAAAEAGVLPALPAAPRELAARLALDERFVRALLDGLAAWRLVEARDDGRYAPGTAAPGPEAAAVLRHHAGAIRRWSERLGAFGREPASSPGDAQPPPMSEIALEFLAANARRLAPDVVDACLERFPRAQRVLDLGGGHGEHALEFARRGLRATVQDRPAVMEAVQRCGQLASAGVDAFVGDFFEVLPEGRFDLVLCAGVTHTYDAERNLELYRRVGPIVAPGGGLAILTFLRARNAVASIFALQMVAVTEGGDTHGEEDYGRWLAACGYGPVQVLDLEDRPQSLLLAAR